MKNKSEFSWMILLLLMEYTLSEDSCQIGPLLGQLSFGSFLPRSVFTTKYQISIYQCATECQLRRQRCKSFNYRRSALSCQLCEEDSGPGGINLQAKAGTDHSNIDTWKNIPIRHCSERNCSWTERCDPSNVDPQSSCVKTECPFAVLKPGVTIHPSNETVVGTKARYRCVSEDMERGRYLTTCLASTAEWYPTDFKCVCKTPVKSGAINQTMEVEIGQNYTYRCQNSLFEKGNQTPTVTCLHDGSWTTTNFVCGLTEPRTILSYRVRARNYICKVTQNWTQDKIYPKNIHTSGVISNETGIDFWECMQQCDDKLNKCLSFFYDNLNSHCVLSSSFKRGLPQGFQFSDKLVYYTAPSTLCDMEYMNIILGGSNFCIKYHREKKFFNEAMKICESEKAKLLVVTNEVPIDELTKILEQSNWVFIGVSDENSEKNWVDWTGEAVSILWHKDEPNGRSVENCGAIKYGRDGVTDIKCGNNEQFLCHKRIGFTAK